jgi:succinate-semialdehyde dehydrogenase / glutarate-semialdehyde dehydrogenase
VRSARPWPPPARPAPLGALAVAQALDHAGLPEGVANFVTTSRPADVAGLLIDSPPVRKLSFTGSADVGRDLLVAAAGQLKRVTLEVVSTAKLKSSLGKQRVGTG